jgi:hypothetical protein
MNAAAGYHAAWRARVRLGCVAGWIVLVLTGCTVRTPEVPADELLRRLQAGEPMLDCRLACLDAWRANRATALVLNETRRWRELAVLVMQNGYTDDLTYFYLGRAAEGLGYREAARTYYQISARLSAAGLACIKENPDLCNGQRLPAAAEARLAELTPPPPAPPPKAPPRRQQSQRQLPASTSRQAKPASVAPARTTASAPTGAAVEQQANSARLRRAATGPSLIAAAALPKFSYPARRRRAVRRARYGRRYCPV